MKRRKQRTSKTISYVFLLFHHRRRYCHVWLLSWFIWLCLFDRMELMLRSALTSPVRKSTPHGLHCDWDLILPLSLSLSLSPPLSPHFPWSGRPEYRKIRRWMQWISFFFFFFFEGFLGFFGDAWDRLWMILVAVIETGAESTARHRISFWGLSLQHHTLRCGICKTQKLCK